MKDQHKKIKGYRDLDQHEIDAMNRLKELEAEVAAVLKDINAEGLDGPSVRALELGRTNLQTGFMWAVRAVAKPFDPFDETEVVSRD